MNFKIMKNIIKNHRSAKNINRSGEIQNVKFKIFRKVRKGFTIAELLFATLIVAVLVTSAAGIYTNFYRSVQNLKAANLIYEEARFTMERIVKEVRQGTIDYEEYYNQTVNFTGAENVKNLTFGSNYCEYSQQFYGPGPDGKFGTFDDESLGKRRAGAPSPLQSIIQKSLYLISPEGDKRTYFKRFEDPVTGLGKVTMLKLNGFDYGLDKVPSESSFACPNDQGERDGLIDTWECAPGFNCACPAGDSTCEKEIVVGCSYKLSHIVDNPTNLEQSSFIDITPEALDIVDLKFFVSPVDDPYKAYASNEDQIQPNVTIKLIVRANPDIASEFKGNPPDIILESTVSARAYNPIITECNLQECIDGTTRECPKKGVAAGTTVTCSQGVWPVCTDELYLNFVNTKLGAPNNLFTSASPPEYNTYFEKQTETGSCSLAFSDPTDIINCKNTRCSDTHDNDGNGVSDINDSACVEDLCHNGRFDHSVEVCTDVGDKCRWRPLLENESSETCFDGYDNDCDGTADEFDPDCVAIMCSNGQLDNTAFVDGSYRPQNYLVNVPSSPSSTLNEACIDVGGLCSTVSKTVNGNNLLQKLETSETGDYCFDGLDNDCDYSEPLGVPTEGADEFDSECVAQICSNGELNDLLADSTFSHKYLFDYRQDVAKASIIETDGDEECIDSGGVCGGPLLENTPALCSDSIDNDCDAATDQEDTGCCPDADNDSFSPLLAGMCTPLTAGVGLPNGEIDCDDSNSTIKPGATEICDDAVYPIGHAKEGKPIDNNCSGVNETTVDGWDHNDPTCCVDVDGDGFGLQDAYLFANSATGECVKSELQHKFDCSDTDPTVNPDTPENCALVGDQNCSGPQSDTDTDDGTDETDPACCIDIDNDGKYTGLSCLAQGFIASDLDCDDSDPQVHPGIPFETCGNLLDDDCNGKTDGADDYCRFTLTHFVDYFSSADYLLTPLDPEIAQTSGTVHLVAPSNFGIIESKPLPVDATCTQISSAEITGMNYSLAGADGAQQDISWQFSNDNGLTWCGDDNCTSDWITLTEFLTNSKTANFSGTGDQLKWKIKLTDLTGTYEISIDDVDISFTCI